MTDLIIIPAVGVVQLDVILPCGERLQLVDALAAALQIVQLVVVDVTLVEVLLILRQYRERLAAVRADPRRAEWLFSDLVRLQGGIFCL